MIVDAHIHIWRQADLPWLSGPMQPRIFGAYEAIRRDYPVTEYLADIAGSGVTLAVYVQANWAPARFAEEAAWVGGVAASSGWPHAIVAYADLTVEDARPQLDRLARLPLVRGVRQQLHWHERPDYRFAARPDLAADPAVIRNVARLADHGFAFDLQIFAPQVPYAMALVEACPRTTFVLEHALMPEDLSDEGRRAWRAGLRRLAGRPNVVCKLSGFGTFLRRNDPAHVAEILRDAVAIFGPERCLWGSNFPIEKLWTGYAALLDAFRAAVRPQGEAAARAIFHDTACRVYRLHPEGGGT